MGVMSGISLFVVIGLSFVHLALHSRRIRQLSFSIFPTVKKETV